MTDSTLIFYSYLLLINHNFNFFKLIKLQVISKEFESFQKKKKSKEFELIIKKCHQFILSLTQQVSLHKSKFNENYSFILGKSENGTY